MGWLHSTPKEEKKSRREQLEGLKTDENAPSHLLDLPELDGAEYLVNLWHEAGTVCKTGMGITGLTWEEIKAWREETETDLEVWEKLSIKLLSDTYASEYAQASDSDQSRPAPYSSVVEPEEIDRPAVAKKVYDVFKELMKDNKRKN